MCTVEKCHISAVSSNSILISFFQQWQLPVEFVCPRPYCCEYSCTSRAHPMGNVSSRPAMALHDQKGSLETPRLLLELHSNWRNSADCLSTNTIWHRSEGTTFRGSNSLLAASKYIALDKSLLFHVCGATPRACVYIYARAIVCVCVCVWGGGGGLNFICLFFSSPFYFILCNYLFVYSPKCQLA